jgi:hypothetical protein
LRISALCERAIPQLVRFFFPDPFRCFDFAVSRQGAFFATSSSYFLQYTAMNVRHDPEPSRPSSFGQDAWGQLKSHQIGTRNSLFGILRGDFLSDVRPLRESLRLILTGVGVFENHLNDTTPCDVKRMADVIPNRIRIEMTHQM